MVCTAPSIRSITGGAPLHVMSKARHGISRFGALPIHQKDAGVALPSYPFPTTLFSSVDSGSPISAPQLFHRTACHCTTKPAAAPINSNFVATASPGAAGMATCTALSAAGIRQPLPYTGSSAVRSLAPQQPAAVVLGIESSCDDTGVAVVTSDGRVLGEAIATQADIHSQWGGVVPNLARDAHAAAIDRTVDSALAAAGVSPQQLSAIAVTIGPGLGLCLRVGAAKARQIARQYGIPLVSVHHMEAHALVARLPMAAAAAAAPAIRLAAVATPTSGAAESSQQQMTMTLRPGVDLRVQGPTARPEQPVCKACDPSSESLPPSPTSHASWGSPTTLGFQQQLLLCLQEAGSPQASCAQDHIAARHSDDGEGDHSIPKPCNGPTTASSSNSSRGTDAAASGGGHYCTTPASAVVNADAVLADVTAAASEVPFPFLCLLVSGGHNLLVLVRDVGQYVQLGSTVDDSLGEAYDKVARLLNLELRPHGGAALEALAREGDPKAFRFAVPMRQHTTCDFSFAGLKTNTRLAIEQHLRPEAMAQMAPDQLRKVKADVAASFQSVAVTHLMEKTRRGVGWARELAPQLRHLVVAGGVACNLVVRSSLQGLAEAEGLELVLPPPRWCTDNGVMVAWAGLERLARGWAEPPPPPLPSPSPSPSSTGGAATASILPGSVDCTTGGQVTTGLNPGSESGSESGCGGPSGEDSASEWIELKPRWPLTSELHPRMAAARQEQRRSVKKVRMHTPLSDLTPPTPTAATTMTTVTTMLSNVAPPPSPPTMMMTTTFMTAASTATTTKTATEVVASVRSYTTEAAAARE